MKPIVCKQGWVCALSNHSPTRELHSITDAMHDFLDASERSDRVVAVIGRSCDEAIGRKRPSGCKDRPDAALDGYLLVSGGGPGAMEATHVGAWFADRTEDELAAAAKHLATEPSYRDFRWLAAAFEVIGQYPPLGEQHVRQGRQTP